jgi:diguanylate cyclase (GGDEF)-like protein/PAS domain S-box-containing protein
MTGWSPKMFSFKLLPVAFSSGIDLTKERRDRRPTTRLFDAGGLSAIGLAAVLVLMPTLAFWGAWTNYGAGMASKRANAVSDAFEQARHSVAAVESLERKYRLDPSEGVRERHAQEAVSVVAWLQRARDLDPSGSSELVDEVVGLEATYMSAVANMFAAVDANDMQRAEAIDKAAGDPSFLAIERQVSAGAAKYRAESMLELDRSAHVQRLVLFSTPVVFGLGLVLVLFFVTALRRYRRQTVDATAVANLRSEQRFRSLVRNASDVILICDASGAITYQAPTAETDWGFATNELCGKGLVSLIHPADQPALREIWQQVLMTSGSTKTVELRGRDATKKWHYGEFVFTNLLQVPGVEGVVATARDVTERKTFELQLIEQAFYDSLTGLPNRALLCDRIEQALARARRRSTLIGVMFIALDNFKRVNDSFGHQSGDALLIAAAKRLTACVRPADTAARLGGDEFVILLDQLTAEAKAEAILMAQRVLKRFEQAFWLEGKEYFVSASIGIALTVTGDVNGTSNALLRDADVAMYRAKSSGRGRYVMFDTSMQRDARARFDLEDDLRHAVERSELRVFFQPIVQLQSKGFREVEALVRWQHPIRGLVMPIDFIAIAEETGLIITIGHWVLEEACRQVAIWQAEFPARLPLQVSVNLSPRQFEHPGLIEDVQRALRTSGIAPGSLELEVTEGIIMRDTEASIQTLRTLKSHGIRIAIDDFGTGYSSLSYLRRLPLDVLKIDRSFVQGIGQNPEDNAIVQAILSMAKSLGLSVTAEGVETNEQAELLREWSCEQAQGFLFARPLNAEDITGILQDLALSKPRARSATDIFDSPCLPPGNSYMIPEVALPGNPFAGRGRQECSRSAVEAKRHFMSDGAGNATWKRRAK